MAARTSDSTNFGVIWDKFHIYQGHRVYAPYIRIGEKRRKPRRPKLEKHSNALKQALHFRDLLESGQADSRSELARLYGTSRNTISNYLRLLSLSEAVQDKALGIDDDDERICMLTEGRLRRLLNQDPDAQRRTFQAVLNGTSKPGRRSR